MAGIQNSCQPLFVVRTEQNSVICVFNQGNYAKEQTRQRRKVNVEGSSSTIDPVRSRQTWLNGQNPKLA